MSRICIECEAPASFLFRIYPRGPRALTDLPILIFPVPVPVEFNPALRAVGMQVPP